MPSMLVRGIRRRFALVAVGAAGSLVAAVVTAIPAAAIGGGFDPAQVGSTFKNEYGSAVVDRLAGICGAGLNGCDISAAHLATPIQAPAFPPLLLDGVPSQPGTTTGGNTLAVGNGGSTTGRPTVGWTQPTPAA